MISIMSSHDTGGIDGAIGKGGAFSRGAGNADLVAEDACVQRTHNGQACDVA